MIPKKKRSSKLDTADAIRQMDSRVVVEWVDREEDYKPPKTNQVTLFGKPADKKEIEKHQERVQKNLKDFAIIGGIIGTALLIGGVATKIYADRNTEIHAYPKDNDGIIAHPNDRIPYGIHIEGAEEIRIADTNSMLPVFDSGHAALGIPIADPNDLQAGDIITFYDQVNDLVIHRIIEIGSDEEGWWAITKGDNNEYEDRPIRQEQLDRVIVGVLY